MNSRSKSALVLRLTAAAFALLVALAPLGAMSEDDAERQAMKQYWQGRYRQLLESADRLRAEVERETELYADANRRNYRRGKKRHIHRVAAEEAREALARVEQELATIEDDARRAGALPGWLYEVEMERADLAKRPDDEQRSEDPTAGRNPRFVEPDDASPASRR